MGRAPAWVVSHKIVVRVNARIAANGKLRSLRLKEVTFGAFRRQKETVVSFSAKELAQCVSPMLSIIYYQLL